MEFRKHLQVKEGDHAYLGASKYHWINYDAEKLWPDGAVCPGAVRKKARGTRRGA